MQSTNVSSPTVFPTWLFFESMFASILSLPPPWRFIYQQYFWQLKCPTTTTIILRKRLDNYHAQLIWSSVYALRYSSRQTRTITRVWWRLEIGSLAWNYILLKVGYIGQVKQSQTAVQNFDAVAKNNCAWLPLPLDPIPYFLHDARNASIFVRE